VRETEAKRFRVHLRPCTSIITMENKKPAQVNMCKGVHANLLVLIVKLIGLDYNAD